MARLGKRWVRWAVIGIVAGVVLGPWAMGPRIREIDALRRITRGWGGDYQVLAWMWLARAQLDVGKNAEAARTLAHCRQMLGTYKGTYPEFMWLALAWLEARAGNYTAARQAIALARKDPRAAGMLRSRLFDPYRDQLGLARR